MNKLILISICIVFIGLFAGQALAEDNRKELAASEFYYGESYVNQDSAVNTSGSRSVSQVELPLSDLAASDFFYGQPVLAQGEISKNENFIQRTEVAAPATPLITPQVFYGYTDAIEAKEAKCSNC